MIDKETILIIFIIVIAPVSTSSNSSEATKGLQNAHPWAVSIQFFVQRAWIHRCGGSLISRLWVLTAASCVNSFPLSDNLRIIIGKMNISSDVKGDGSIIVGISKAISHKKPSRAPTNLGLYMLKTTARNPLGEKRTFDPICLPFLISVQPSFAFKRCSLGGWILYTEGVKPMPEIRNIDVIYIPSENCQKYMPKRYEVSKHAICALVADDSRTKGAGIPRLGSGVVCPFMNSHILVGVTNNVFVSKHIVVLMESTFLHLKWIINNADM